MTQARIRFPDELDIQPRTEAELPNSVPRACGWRLLIRIAEPPEKIGSVFTPPSYRDGEKALAMTAQVMQCGADCYTDPHRFPSGQRWCQPGDWVLISKYAGTRFAVRGVEYRICNDDEIQGVFMKAEDADEVKRV